MLPKGDSTIKGSCYSEIVKFTLAAAFCAMMRQFGAIQCRRFIYLCSRQHVIKSCCPSYTGVRGTEKWQQNRKGIKAGDRKFISCKAQTDIRSTSLDFARLEEIRLRCGQPILFRIAGKEMGITGSGDLTELGSSGKLENWEKLEKIREKELKDTLEIMGGFSLYAAEEELRQGFLQSGAVTGSGLQGE